MNAVVELQPAPLLKLDLGAGHNPKEGFLGIDRRKFPNIKANTNLGDQPWIFENDELLPGSMVKWNNAWTLPDNSVGEVHCSHFLEHLDHNQHNPERVRFMNELYRVLAPGAKALIITPHWCSERAYGDFTHADKPVSEMFWYYVKREWRKVNAPDNDIEWNPQGYSCDFEATWAYGLRQDLIVRSQDYQMFALGNFKGAASDLICTVTALK